MFSKDWILTLLLKLSSACATSSPTSYVGSVYKGKVPFEQGYQSPNNCKSPFINLCQNKEPIGGAGTQSIPTALNWFSQTLRKGLLTGCYAHWSHGKTSIDFYGSGSGVFGNRKCAFTGQRKYWGDDLQIGQIWESKLAFGLSENKQVVSIPMGVDLGQLWPHFQIQLRTSSVGSKANYLLHMFAYSSKRQTASLCLNPKLLSDLAYSLWPV